MATFKAKKIQYSRLTTVTSGGTLTLTASAKQIQIFTGSSNHIMKLPDATTTSNGSGISISVINSSSGIITVQDNGSNVLTTVAAGSSLDILLTDHSTSNGTWRLGSFSSSGGGGAGSVAPSNLNPGTRALVAGGSGPVSLIEYMTINTAANAAAFGNLSSTRQRGASGTSSTTRGIFGGGETGAPASVNTIEYALYASQSTAINFGTLTQARTGLAGCASATRAVFSAGDTTPAGPSVIVNTMDYVTMASVGNATSFGTLGTARLYTAGMASPTRGIIAGGESGSVLNSIEYITIATTGNGTSFGTMGTARKHLGCCASSTRGLIGGGNTGSISAVISYITIATTGNDTSFGSLTAAKDGAYSASSNTIGLWAGGFPGGTTANIDYVTIATTANAANFGVLTAAKGNTFVNSNCHGGLQ